MREKFKITTALLISLIMIFSVLIPVVNATDRIFDQNEADNYYLFQLNGINEMDFYNNEGETYDTIKAECDNGYALISGTDMYIQNNMFYSTTAPSIELVASSEDFEGSIIVNGNEILFTDITQYNIPEENLTKGNHPIMIDVNFTQKQQNNPARIVVMGDVQEFLNEENGKSAKYANGIVSFTGNDIVSSVDNGQFLLDIAIPQQVTITVTPNEGYEYNLFVDGTQMQSPFNLPVEANGMYNVDVEFVEAGENPGPEPSPAVEKENIDFDIEFTDTVVNVWINNNEVISDGDGQFKNSFKGTIEEAGTIDPDKTNVIKLIPVFGEAPVKEYKINGVVYKEGDDGVTVGEYGEFTIVVPGAEKYTITGTGDEDFVRPRTIIWTNPNYVPKDAEDAEWIEEFSLDHGYAYITAVYDVEGNLVDPDEYKSADWVVDENGGGVGADGFGWISIYPEYRAVFEFVPEYGYQLTDIRINGEKLGATDLMNQFEFIMPDTNIHFDAEFTKTSDIVKAESKKISSGKIKLGNTLPGGSAQLTVNDVKLSSDKIVGFENAAGEYTISNYLDIDLYNVYYKGKDDSEDVWSDKIDELDNEATITLKLEDGINADDIVIVHNVHDGEKYEIIKIESYNKKTNTITFKTKSFSNYTIATKESVETEDVKDDDKNEETDNKQETEEVEETSNLINPKTGDNVIVFAVIFVIAVAGIVTIVAVKKINKK